MKRKDTIITLTVITFIIAGIIDYNRFVPKREEVQIDIIKEMIAEKINNTAYIKIYDGIDDKYYYQQYTINSQFLKIDKSTLDDNFKKIELFENADIKENVKEVESWEDDLQATEYYIFDSLSTHSYTLILTDHSDNIYSRRVSLVNNLTVKEGELMEWLNNPNTFVKEDTAIIFTKADFIDIEPSPTYVKSGSIDVNLYFPTICAPPYIKIEKTTLLKYYKDFTLVNKSDYVQGVRTIEAQEAKDNYITYYVFESLDAVDYELVLTDFANQKHHINISVVNNTIVKKDQLLTWLSLLPDFATQ